MGLKLGIIYNIFMLSILGIASAALNFTAYVPYIRDILRGRTKPQRVTWFIFSIMGVSSFVSQAVLGATDVLWLAGAQTGATVVIAFLSIKHGMGGSSRMDILVFCASLIGVILWLTLGKAQIALYINIAAAVIAVMPTARKSWHQPQTETLLTWVLGTIAGCCALIASGFSELSSFIFPLHVTLINGVVAAILLRGKFSSRWLR